VRKQTFYKANATSTKSSRFSQHKFKGKDQNRLCSKHAAYIYYSYLARPGFAVCGNSSTWLLWYNTIGNLSRKWYNTIGNLSRKGKL
jgi:hypothetical protein